MKTRVIVNPHSSNNRTGRQWPQIEKRLEAALGEFRVDFTHKPLDATQLCRQALEEGVDRVIAVGGDGTGNEVMNGFFQEDKAINPEAVFAFITSGTGGDYRKTFAIPKAVDAQIKGLAEGNICTVDIGKLHFFDHEGLKTTRFFNNITSFGLSGHLDQTVNQLNFAKKLGGPFAYKWALFKTLLTYKRQKVRLQVDDHFDEEIHITVAAVCNGQYFGGGMHMAPEARPDDGLFDIIIVADSSNAELLLHIGSLYKGTHLSNPKVMALQGRRVIVTPCAEEARPVLMDVDGEAPGRLPATFEIVPKALQLQC